MPRVKIKFMHGKSGWLKLPNIEKWFNCDFVTEHAKAPLLRAVQTMFLTRIERLWSISFSTTWINRKYLEYMIQRTKKRLSSHRPLQSSRVWKPKPIQPAPQWWHNLEHRKSEDQNIFVQYSIKSITLPTLNETNYMNMDLLVLSYIWWTTLLVYAQLKFRRQTIMRYNVKQRNTIRYTHCSHQGAIQKRSNC